MSLRARSFTFLTSAFDSSAKMTAGGGSAGGSAEGGPGIDALEGGAEGMAIAELPVGSVGRGTDGGISGVGGKVTRNSCWGR